MSDKRSSVAIRILFLIATFSAIISLVLLYSYVSSADERALKSLDTAKVLIATKEIPQGTTLDQALKLTLIDTRNYPVQSVPKNSLQEVTTSNGNLVALGDIAAGQILLVESFGERVPPKVELSPTKGNVAVTVELGYGARLGTFLKPGIYVSLFATTTDPKTAKKTTTLLFDSLEILAIGAQVSQDQTVAKDAASNFVTFAVAIDKASMLIEAAQTASLYLALPGDSVTKNS